MNIKIFAADPGFGETKVNVDVRHLTMPGSGLTPLFQWISWLMMKIDAELSQLCQLFTVSRGFWVTQSKLMKQLRQLT